MTYSPLSGSSRVFDRRSIGGAAIGVSDQVLYNNLVMVNLGSEGQTDAPWPQMQRTSTCSQFAGELLAMYPALDVKWEGWLALHPETLVVSSETGYDHDYYAYPYGDYEVSHNGLTTVLRRTTGGVLLLQRTYEPRSESWRPPANREWHENHRNLGSANAPYQWTEPNPTVAEVRTRRGGLYLHPLLHQRLNPSRRRTPPCAFAWARRAGVRPRRPCCPQDALGRPSPESPP